MTVGYQPLKVTGMETGLVQNRQEFILPNDAYPVLENMFLFREQMRRKQGFEFLGRLRRTFTLQPLGTTPAAPTTIQFNVLSIPGVAGLITNITQNNPGNVTSPVHNLVTGDSIIISGVVGMTQVNGGTFTVTVTGPNNFTIGVDTTAFGAYVSGGRWVDAAQPNAEVQPGSVLIMVAAPDAATFTDNGLGGLVATGAGVTAGSSINYSTGTVTLVFSALTGGAAVTASVNYFPSLPVMGLRTKQLNAINSEQLVAFDTIYAYRFSASGFVEYIPGTTWTGTDFNFFWSTNYWVSLSNTKIFWVTNDSGVLGDPIRYTDGTAWIDFAPTIDNGGNKLQQCLALLPFRGRFVAFNTLEGATLAGSTSFSNRIRWAEIGNPFDTVSAIVATVVPNAWNSDIRGKGGFLDIPTSEDIISVGFVRDNLVIYCESSTWQLRYTGRSIAPFQIEKVNTELGAESTFSTVQFDTSLVGVGDKGIVECDSYKSERIDIKIPDLVFQFNNNNNGPQRVHGTRDFIQRLAYWTYPYTPTSTKFPNRRLVYNYENDSWAIFTDSLTCFGTFQPVSNRTWANTQKPWRECNFSWVNRPLGIPDVVGGNQQGYVLYCGGDLEGGLSTNEKSLTINNITGNTTTSTVITSVNHNLQTNDIISISEIPLGTPFANSLNNPLQGIITGATQANPCQITSASHNLLSGDSVTISGVVGMTQLNNLTFVVTVTGVNTFTLNGIDSTSYTAYVSGGTWTKINNNVVFQITRIDDNNFSLEKFNTSNGTFDIAQLDPPGTYIGGGQIRVRDNFRIVSKKFNFMDQGQNIQIGYIDILMDSTENGAITLKMYVDYDTTQPTNTLPNTNQGDSFFNSVVPTNASELQNVDSDKIWQRVICPVRGNFVTIEWTLSDGQMNGVEQESDVQIDAQVIWQRPAGRMSF